MTTWIFGDEHVDPVTVSDMDSLALPGTALEFMYYRFNIARKKIKANDTVVVALTNFDRRWFFKHAPEVAITDESPTGDKKENKAISMFRKYLDHKEIHQVYLIDFLYNLHALTEEFNLNTIVVPVYEDTKEFLSNKQEEFPLFKFLYVDEAEVTAKVMEVLQ